LALGLAFGCSSNSKTIVANQRYSQDSDSSFAVGLGSILEVENFAGTVDVAPGIAGVVAIEARKWTGHPDHLNEIGIEMLGIQDTVRVSTTNPEGRTGANVDIQATIPADARPMVHVGAGNINYRGRPNGLCTLGTGAGTITIRLPADVNVEVHLSVGAGSIQVGFPVVGQTNAQLVDGVIGTGADGRIEVTVGAGSIIVEPQ